MLRNSGIFGMQDSVEGSYVMETCQETGNGNIFPSLLQYLVHEVSCVPPAIVNSAGTVSEQWAHLIMSQNFCNCESNMALFSDGDVSWMIFKEATRAN